MSRPQYAVGISESPGAVFFAHPAETPLIIVGYSNAPEDDEFFPYLTGIITEVDIVGAS